MLATESQEHSMQHVIVNALRQRQGLPPLSGAESARLCRACDDISPEATLFLMGMYDHSHSPEEVNAEAELVRIEAAGLTLADLCRD